MTNDNKQSYPYIPGIRDGKRKKILFQAYFPTRPKKPVRGWCSS